MRQTTQKKQRGVIGIIATVIIAVILLTVQGYITDKLHLNIPPVLIQAAVFIAAGIATVKFVRDTYTYTYCISGDTLYVYRSVGHWDSPLCEVNKSLFVEMVVGENSELMQRQKTVSVNRCYTLPEYEPVTIVYRTGLRDHKAALIIRPNPQMLQNISDLLLDK